MGQVYHICESCRRHAAKVSVWFPRSEYAPAKTFKVCQGCVSEMTGNGVVTKL